MVCVKFVPENMSGKIEYKTFLSREDALNHMQRHGYIHVSTLSGKYYKADGNSYAEIILDDVAN